MLNYNRLLKSLSAADYRQLSPLLQFVPMPRGLILNPAGGNEAYLYFPTTSTVSLLNVMNDGEVWEGAVIGNDGLVGISLLAQATPGPTIAEVQSTGGGYRINTALLNSEAHSTNALRCLAMRYSYSLVTQIMQTAACNRHHRIEQQVCRWILLRLDRVISNELAITQGELAVLLGVRRQVVAGTIQDLQAAGILQYTRGKIKILERPKVEARACACYETIRQDTERSHRMANKLNGFERSAAYRSVMS